MVKRLLLAVAVLILAEGAAFGQALQWNEGRYFLSANGGFHQSSDREERAAFSFSLYEETATVDVKRTVSGGSLGDFMAGARVRRNFGVAAGFVVRSADSDGAITGSIPDPIFFDRPRTVTATFANMIHREKWYSAQAVYLVQLNTKASIMLLAGPAVVSVRHDLAGSATAAEGTSGPSVTVDIRRAEKTVWGYLAGVDIRYMLTKAVGVGAFGRYAAATANLTGENTIELGGFQVGAGVRFAFK